ncbi:2-(3-amino-3-carboxypropyl)histidine synthase subunit 2 [Anaeramoeba flamelloides]|uniref:2-(3-amino-3-carboxypropyl)histidine synthase subunit 2 n=1 Tax=Anaeramoeba flamelloides TaxID=1746091 RepID=A0ABQ8Y343_9EUKA|nr:2-(3-amino-3-carboxypropyl)histidine synthase subunit 2 [Anaeramoeba flamelloides]
MENFDEQFSITKTVEFIQKNKSTRVILQLPPKLLQFSSKIEKHLKKALKNDKISFFILAGASTRHCCVDTVSSARVFGDLIVHYGHSCLSSTAQIPILNIFIPTKISIQNIISAFETEFSTQKTKQMILFYSTEVENSISGLYLQLNKTFPNLKRTFLNLPKNEKEKVKKLEQKQEKEQELEKEKAKEEEKEQQQQQEKENLKIFGRVLPITDITQLSKNQLIWLGSSTNPTLFSLALTFGAENFLVLDPEKEYLEFEKMERMQPMRRILMKRYALIEKAKKSENIGIVVGTTNPKKDLQIVKYLQLLIKNSKKKSQVISMGVVKSLKLGNFVHDLDLFVVIGCNESLILDQSDYYRPVLVPDELDLALNHDREWDGTINLNFYPNHDMIANLEKKLKQSFDLILIEQQNQKQIENLIISRSETRSFKGLETRLGENKVTKIEEGLSGRASQYQDEIDLN